MNGLFRMLARMVTVRANFFTPMASRYRSRRVVKCPDFDQAAEILVDATPGSPLKPKKKAFSIRDCSLWPKGKGCTQSCVK